MTWQGYLTEFHRDRAAITSQVLGVSRDDQGNTPYSWLLTAVPGQGSVLDLACGSGPLGPRLAGRPYVGVDTSASELAVAQRRGVGPLIQASAAAIPVATASVDTVVCSMALMVAAPLRTVLAEVRRVLVVGGRLVATMPTSDPRDVADLPVVVGLLAVLGRGLRYPNDDELSDLRLLLAKAGMRMDSDEHRRFGYRFGDAGDTDRFLASLYLPGLSPRRYRLTRVYLRSLCRYRVEMPVPIRRVVATAI